MYSSLLETQSIKKYIEGGILDKAIDANDFNHIISARYILLFSKITKKDLNAIPNNHIIISVIIAALSNLDDRDRMIISYRYGLESSEPLRQKELAIMYNLSLARISAIELRALKRLSKTSMLKTMSVKGYIANLDQEIERLKKEREHYLSLLTPNNISPSSNSIDLLMTIEELPLSTRTLNCLRFAGIHNLQDIVSKTDKDIMRIKSLGRKSYEELIKVLNDYSLFLKPSAN
ncbi:MAG: DNA-directed RNA polymerase subunit alpha C-terminal domain-containing protein [Clostridia bacterium]|nr:DNA-directed RNA polymerase subunit alpha C-terminal domain-containing protein [Clostridia bacterium]MDD4376459.1 DNA-directed RNA polymerase subunit alpha C-terminal domain-containing protein [Clostridia bacterium]